MVITNLYESELTGIETLCGTQIDLYCYPSTAHQSNLKLSAYVVKWQVS